MRRHLMALSLACFSLFSIHAPAQEFPNKTIRIINPFPGGPTDSFARLIASKLQSGLKQSVIVDAKPGAGGTIAVAAAAKAVPDGYTLLITSASTQIVQPVVRKSIPYDAEKDFIPIMATGGSASVIVVHPHCLSKISANLLTTRVLIQKWFRLGLLGMERLCI